MTRKIKRFILGAFAGCLLGGCAWVHQDATLILTPRIAAANIGNGATVAVRVLDRRPDRVLGYRGLDSKNASITSDQDLAAVFERKIIEGFASKGFRAVPYVDQPAGVLTVEVRQIAYTTDLEMWKGSVQTTCALRVVTSRNGATFDQTYLGARKESAAEAPRAKTNERLISAAMSDAVQRLFEDARLTGFLVQ